MSYLATDDADLQKVGILGVVLLVDEACVFFESLTQDTKILGGLEHELTSITFGDLDIAFEDGIVAEAKLQGRNSHRLGNGAEVEHTLLAETGQVEKTLFAVLQCIEDHLRVAVERRLLVLRFEKILEVVDMLRPDFLGPEPTLIVKVFPNITDDVGLLEEETHGLVEMRALQQGRVAELGLDEQTGETLADQAGHVVTVEVVFLNSLHTRVIILGLGAVVGHAVTHLVGDVLDDGLVGGLHVLELSDDIVELNQQLAVLLLRAVPIERPAILGQNILEVPKERLLGLEGNGGVVLDGVQTAKHEIEYTHGKQQFRVQLLDDGAEAAASLVQEFETRLLGLGLVGFVALMRRVMPDFPIKDSQLARETTAEHSAPCKEWDTNHWTTDLNWVGWKAK